MPKWVDATQVVDVLTQMQHSSSSYILLKVPLDSIMWTKENQFVMSSSSNLWWRYGLMNELVQPLPVDYVVYQSFWTALKPELDAVFEQLSSHSAS